MPSSSSAGGAGGAASAGGAAAADATCGGDGLRLRPRARSRLRPLGCTGTLLLLLLLQPLLQTLRVGRAALVAAAAAVLRCGARPRIVRATEHGDGLRQLGEERGESGEMIKWRDGGVRGCF